MTEPKYPDVYVKLVGEDGNAFAILGRVRESLRRAGHKEAVDEFTKEATSDDYDNLLRTVMKYVNVNEDDEDDEDKF